MKRKCAPEQDQWSIMFGTVLQEVMRKSYFSSIAPLSKKAGISFRQIERLMYEKNGNPTLYTICSLAKALGIHPKELFDFDIKKKYKRTNNNNKITSVTPEMMIKALHGGLNHRFKR